MAEHIPIECHGECDQPYGCQFCAGGLFGCKVCGGLEGSLTTECAGERLSYERDQEVYRGEIDFRDGAWVRGISKYSPAAYRV